MRWRGASQCSAPDLPGHGFSDPIAFDGRPPQVATRDHLLHLVSALGHEQLRAGRVVIRWIDCRIDGAGGSRSRSTSVCDRERLDLHFGAAQEQALRAVLANATTALRAPTLDNCRRRMANICFRAESVAEEVLLVQLTFYALPDRLRVFTDTIEALIASADAGEGSVHEQLSGLRMPTLVIVGRDDIRADWRAHERGAAQMPHAPI